jgi:two-component system response regulator MprA
LVVDQVLECGDLKIDVAAYQVTAGGDLIDVFPKQLDLLTALVRNEGKVMTYSALARILWGLEGTDDPIHSMRTLISKLRKVLGVGPLRPSIETELHVGYRLVPPERRDSLSEVGGVTV